MSKVYLPVLLILITSINILAINLEYGSDLLFSKITVEDGLSHNIVNAICEDKEGYIWFGTKRGINRYDGYTIESYTRSKALNNPFIESEVSTIVLDRSGQLWIGTYKGLFEYDYLLDVFKYYPQSNDLKDNIKSLYVDNVNNLYIGSESGLYILDRSNGSFVPIIEESEPISVLSIAKDRIGNIFVGTWEKGLYIFDSREKKIIHKEIFSSHKGMKNRVKVITSISIVHDSIVYIGTDLGIFSLNSPSGNTYALNIVRPSLLNNKLSNNKVHSLIADDGKLWVGTEYGLNIIELSSGKTTYAFSNVNEPTSLSNNLIRCIYKDKNNLYWLGTYMGGVNVYYPYFVMLKDYFPDINFSAEQNKRYVKSICEDSQGQLWIGTDYGLLKYSSLRATFSKSYIHDPQNANSIGIGGVSALYNDSKDRFWIGTWGGGVQMYQPERDNFIRLPWIDGIRDNPNYLGDVNTRAIHEDGFGNLWFGSTRGYLDKYNPETKLFEHFYLKSVDSTVNSEIICITSSPQGQVWIGTLLGGLFRLDVNTKTIEQFSTTSKIINRVDFSLPSNDVYSIHICNKNYVWIGTDKGLTRIDIRHWETKTYNVLDGLSSNLIYSIVQDNNDLFWLSTPKGITMFNPDNKTAINYDKYNKVRVNSECGFIDSRGWVFFGGPNGINSFDPADMHTNSIRPNISFTGIYINDEKIPIGESSILEQSLDYVKQIKLKHNQNVITFKFALLNFVQPFKNKYKCILEGYDRDWVYLSEDNSIRYSNIKPGKYVFRVEAANNDGVWTNNKKTIELVISPPWWKTIWFKFLIFVLLITLVLFLVMFRTYRLKINKAILEQQVRQRTRKIEEQKIKIEEQALKIHKIDKLKIEFFTNVSHEFRTPLTLIINPIKNIISDSHVSSKFSEEIKVLNKNIIRFRSLIDQFLDLYKVDSQTLKLKLVHGNVTRFLQNVANEYRHEAELKGVKFSVKCEPLDYDGFYDPDKLEKITLNLVSNAIKNVFSNGTIEVSIGIKKVMVDKDEVNTLEIKVKDTGRGIPEDKLNKIFDRFYQIDSKVYNYPSGTGIGLSLTKNLVDIYNGTIEVHSRINEYTEFQVYLPVDRTGFKDFNLEQEIEYQNNLPTIVENENIDHRVSYLDNKLPSPSPSLDSKILLVEDNNELMSYLASSLSPFYNIIMAFNGLEGLKLAISELPDIIISDIMMPEMDGLEMCQRIKSENISCHIPVVLLSAKASIQDRIAGYDLFADAYISKPFDLQELMGVIKQLLMNRHRMKMLFQREMIIQPKNLTIDSADEKLLKRIIKTLDDKMSDPNFGVEELGREVGLSRTHVYRKIKELTGFTAIEFIRNMRLIRSAHMLQENKHYVSEIAYLSGFKDLAYFRRIFKEVFGLSPKEYVAKSPKERLNIFDFFPFVSKK